MATVPSPSDIPSRKVVRKPIKKPYEPKEHLTLRPLLNHKGLKALKAELTHPTDI